MNHKIQPTHLEREAYVYVRQSTLGQVRHRLEGQRRQYDLAERARELGFARVTVIDDDMGRSGTGSEDRPGFGRLLTAVCTGRVGAVFALEASRLARNNRDWHHLIDLCAMTHTLVIDHDGAYDPTQLNDRLVLGLKGTMSEFEMNLLRQRAQESLRQKVRRGKVLTQVPIGFVRTEDHGIELTPDLQVQQAIHCLFRKFRELGSVRQVFLWYLAEKLSFPTWGSLDGRRQAVWRTPVYARLFSILKNPVYAGAFVYGRRRSRTRVVNGRAQKTDGHWVPQDEWDVFILDHHGGYIAWDDFLQNQKQLESNAAMRGKMDAAGGAARNGPALLGGLLRCGYCGRMLRTHYGGDSGRRVSYRCPGDQGRHAGSSCISFGGWRVDREVSAEVLEAVQPCGIQASLDAWRRMQSREDEKREALRLAMEKARYESDRIRRQYDAAEPENRLVAAELERRWNESLQHVASLESSLNAVSAGEKKELGDGTRDQLLRLGEDLQHAWDHPACPISLKKRILRTVLEEVVVRQSKEPPRLMLKLHWAGGAHTDLTVVKNRTGVHNRCNDRQVVDLVRDLAQVCRDEAIVSILNRLGYRTGTGNTWTESRVQHLRHTQGIPVCPPVDQRPWLTMDQAARHLQVSTMVIRRLLSAKVLPGRQIVKHAPWMIDRKDLELPPVRRAIRLVHEGRRAPLIVSDPSESLLFQGTCEG